MPSWNHDGTQDPSPPPMMPDPLSGLVTGNKFDSESVRVRVVEPSMPDIEAVREAMASVLDEDSELAIPRPLPRPVPRPVVEIPALPPADPGANDPDAGDGGTGVGPAANVANPPTPPVGIPAPARAMDVEFPAPRRRMRPPRPVRRSSWSPGLAAVALLLLVIGVLVIVMLASLMNTIASIFS